MFKNLARSFAIIFALAALLSCAALDAHAQIAPPTD